MEYTPRYAQPFTLAEAVALEVSVITDEIARLGNSLSHLQKTQDVLREFQLTETPEAADPEVQKALEENEVVIGSQTERIFILRMALVEKGVLDHRHYDLPNVDAVTSTAPRVHQESNQNPAVAMSRMDTYNDAGSDDGEGVHL